MVRPRGKSTKSRMKDGMGECYKERGWHGGIGWHGKERKKARPHYNSLQYDQVFLACPSEGGRHIDMSPEPVIRKPKETGEWSFTIDSWCLLFTHTHCLQNVHPMISPARLLFLSVPSLIVVFHLSLPSSSSPRIRILPHTSPNPNWNPSQYVSFRFESSVRLTSDSPRIGVLLYKLRALSHTSRHRLSSFPCTSSRKKN